MTSPADPDKHLLVETLGVPAVDCVGSSRKTEWGCPMWTEWMVNINTCGSSGHDIRPPKCNENDYPLEFRYCHIGAIPGTTNPRNGEIFENDDVLATQATDSSLIAFNYPRNADCGITPRTVQPDSTDTTAGDYRYTSTVNCGILMSNFFECTESCSHGTSNGGKWCDKEIKRWIVIAVIFALGVLLHSIIPLHFIPFFG